MGLFDILKPKSPLEKAAKDVKEIYAQGEVRRGAMDKLFEIGTPEAYHALLMRFTVTASGQIADEAEKRDLVEYIVKEGEGLVDALKNFIKTEQAIAFPIQALVRIIGRGGAREFLAETLQTFEPMDHRSTKAKSALIHDLVDLSSSEHASLFVPYLGDHDDDIQFQSIVALETLANDETRSDIVAICVGDDHSPRIQRRAAQALITLQWSAKAKYQDFNAELKDEYLLGKKGLLIKKHAS